MPDVLATPTAAPFGGPPPAADAPNPFDALDATLGFDTPAAPEKKPAAEKEEAAPEGDTEAEETPAETAPVAEEKPAAKPAVKAKTEGGKLRENFEKAQAELKDLRAKIAEKDAKGGDTTALTERLATIEKERDEARREAAMARQEKTPEFKEKWEKPIAEAAESARAFFNQLVVDTEGRQADWDKDFPAIYSLPYPAARALAQKLFPEDSQQVMGEYRKLHDLQSASEKAWTAEKAGYAERQKAQEAETAKWTEARKSGYAQAHEGWVKKFPERYALETSDKEGDNLFKNALALVDAVPKTFQEEVAKNTRVRLAAAAEPRYLRQIKSLKAEKAALEAKIAAMNGSKPGGGKPGVTKTAEEPEGMDAASIRRGAFGT